jgi:hypothetical protein
VTPQPAEAFAFVDGLRLEVHGSRRTLAHFRAEYGAARAEAGPEPGVAVSFRRPDAESPLRFAGGYRSLRWQVDLEGVESDRLRATIHLRGAPRSFGLSLLQGYVVEPLLALVAADAGHVLLPAAAVASDDAAILLLGRSRSGKSSLVARAAAAGTRVLGDDHVLVGSDGCRAFPRRLRLYPDLAQTAPAAHALLSGRKRALLHALAVIRAATGGAVAPPARVPIESIGAVAHGPLPLARVVVLERREVRRLSGRELSLDELVATAGAVLREQRGALEQVEDARWRERLDRVRAAEEALLRSVFSQTHAPTRRLAVSTDLPAGEAVAAIAAELSEGF